MHLIAGDELDLPSLRRRPEISLLNLRGDQREGVGLVAKMLRVCIYYKRLIQYALKSRAPIFHVLWNNKFEYFDRTLLMLYYRLLRKQIVMTVHNVNVKRRDGDDTWLNRMTLRVQYRLANHLFVHTESMRAEIKYEFGVDESKVTVIPFGINNAVPQTELSSREAKRRLGLEAEDRTILFFGRITPYKGVDLLIAAFRQALTRMNRLRLVIAGRPDGCEKYWRAIRENIRGEVLRGQILVREEFIPDVEAEVYFKAADVLALPYRSIYQSGVLFLAQSFGLPVLASDAGSLKDDVIEGQNGFTFRRDNDRDLAEVINRYFCSDLYAGLENYRNVIREQAARKHSWSAVAEITTEMYQKLL